MKNAIINAIKSFKKSIFINIMLIVELSICFWLICLIINNYFDMGYQRFDKQFVFNNNMFYYQLNMNNEMELISDLYNSNETVIKVEKFLDELKNQADIKYMHFSSFNPIDFNEDILDKKIPYKNNYNDNIDQGKWYSKKGYKKFIYGYFDNIQIPEPKRTSRRVSLQSQQIDFNAYNNFDLQFIKGKGFIPEDFIFKKNQDYLPIILGYGYKDYFIPGDIIPLFYNGKKMDSKIIGILKKESVLTLNPYSDGDEINTVDNSIISPLFTYNYNPVTIIDKEIQSYHLAFMVSSGHLVVGEEADSVILTKNFYDLCKKYNMMKYIPGINSTTSGIEMFRNESEQNMKAIILLIAIMVELGLYILIGNVITKIDDGLHDYMVFLMNGSKLSYIILQYLIEIFLIFISIFLIDLYLLRKEIGVSFEFILIILFLVIFTCLLSSTVIYCKLKNIKTDEILRRNE